MTNSCRVWNSVSAIVALVVSSCATSAQAQLLVQGYTPATAGMYDRFLNDPSFIGNGYNWSGVGRGIFKGQDNSIIQTGTWGTMISPTYFISANHYNPTSVGANNLRFYYTNDVNDGFEDRTYTTVGRIANSDLWLGRLTTPVSDSVAKYPIISMPEASYASLPIYIFGLSAPSPGTDATVRLGTNTIEVHNMLGSSMTPTVVNASVFGTVGYSYTFSYTAGAGGGEAMLQTGDSGAPNFYLVNGNMPAIIGLNWFALQNPDGSGSTAIVPQYLAALQAAMIEAPSIVKNPAVVGDYSLDGLLNGADLHAMANALADLERYKSLHGITQDYLLQIGDLNHDLAITNADLQPLINLLGANGAGGGGIITVPEPVSAVLFALGTLAVAIRRIPSSPLRRRGAETRLK